MINILFPAIHFCIALIVAMLLLGYLDRRSEKSLRTGDIVLVLGIPWIAVQVLSLAIRADLLPIKLQIIAMSLYLFLPFWLFKTKYNKSKFECFLYSLVIFVSAFFSGAVLSLFYQQIS